MIQTNARDKLRCTFDEFCRESKLFAVFNLMQNQVQTNLNNCIDAFDDFVRLAFSSTLEKLDLTEDLHVCDMFELFYEDVIQCKNAKSFITDVHKLVDRFCTREAVVCKAKEIMIDVCVSDPELDRSWIESVIESIGGLKKAQKIEFEDFCEDEEKTKEEMAEIEELDSRKRARDCESDDKRHKKAKQTEEKRDSRSFISADTLEDPTDSQSGGKHKRIVNIKRRTPFSAHEDALIVHGLQKFGWGHWSSILSLHQTDFNASRTSVSLKDRARNMQLKRSDFE